MLSHTALLKCIGDCVYASWFSPLGDSWQPNCLLCCSIFACQHTTGTQESDCQRAAWGAPWASEACWCIRSWNCQISRNTVLIYLTEGTLAIYLHVSLPSLLRCRRQWQCFNLSKKIRRTPAGWHTLTLMGDGWLDSPTSCDVSNWEQSFLFGENKHFDNPSTVNPSHPSNNGIPGISPIPVATLPLDLVCMWGGPGIQKNDIKFPNFSTPHILYKLLSICQTPLIWADVFEYKYPVQGGYFQEQFQQKTSKI